MARLRPGGGGSRGPWGLLAALGRPVGWGVWMGFLALPLMGPRRSGVLAAGVAGALLLARCVRRAWETPGVARRRAAAAEKVQAARARIASFDPRARAGAFLSLLVLLPWFLDRYSVDVLTVAGIYVVLALGLNIVVGFAGLLDLGYVAFYAVGAYTYALLSTRAGFSFWEGLPAGALLAAVFGVMLGVPVLRLRGDYLAIVTLGFGEMIRIVLNNWDSFTNGPNGILGIPRPAVDLGGLFFFRFRHPLHYYYLILLMGVGTVFVVRRLERSRVGRAWLALREDETAAECMGIDTHRAKLLAFGLGATWAGFAGVFFAAKQIFVSPESFTFFESVLILCMVVLGGMGSIPGVILGAVMLVVLPEVMRDLSHYRMLLFGGAMVFMMVMRPEGLISRRRRPAVMVPRGPLAGPIGEAPGRPGPQGRRGEGGAG